MEATGILLSNNIRTTNEIRYVFGMQYFVILYEENGFPDVYLECGVQCVCVEIQFKVKRLVCLHLYVRTLEL